MGYLKRYGRRSSRAMGDISSTITTALDVAADPYLPEVVCRVQQLTQIDHGQPVQACLNTPDTVVGGVGIARAIPALRAYVYAQENPWVYYVAAAGLIGLPMLIGYRLGKG